jgi:tRNA pseudouridine55 synthase
VTSAFVLIDKPVGITSFRALNTVKSRFGTKRVGHAGTLDLAASGLIVAAFGKCTRLLPYIEAQEKVYSFNLHLGLETDTLEPTGKILKQDGKAQRTAKEIDAVLQAFTGETEQIPPTFSAIKINGKRASDLALKGQNIELKPRKIFIHELYRTGEPAKIFPIYCKCSKGTYIRSLARDIAVKLGTCGVAGSIRRLAIGGISVERASDRPVLPQELLNWEIVKVNGEEAQKILNGMTVEKFPSPGEVPKKQAVPVFISQNNQIIAVAELQNGYLVPEFLL